MDPGHTVGALLGSDGRYILENVHLLLARREFEFDGALTTAVRHGNLHRGADAHSGQLVVDRHRCRFSVELHHAISSGYSSAVCIAVGIDGSHFRLAPEVCTGAEPGRGSLDCRFRDLQADESKQFVVRQLLHSGHVVMKELDEALTGYRLCRLLYAIRVGEGPAVPGEIRVHPVEEIA